MVNDDIKPAPGQAGEPVGRVRVAAEPEQWSNSAGDTYEGGWTLQQIALGAVIILIMAALLAFILWGAVRLGV